MNFHDQYISCREHECFSTHIGHFKPIHDILHSTKNHILHLNIIKQNRRTEGCSKQVRERMVSTLEQMQVPNGTGPGVRRSKRPLLASRTRCNILWRLPTFGNKVIKSVIKPSSVISSQIGVMSDQLRVSLYMVMSKNVMYYLGEGDFIMFDEIPISTIKLPEGRFQTFYDISLSEELR